MLKIGKFTYFPNGATSPVLASSVGGLARFIQSITYSATGVQTIVFTSDFGFAGTARFYVQATAAALASTFEATPIGAYNATTRTLVIQQRQGQIGYAAAADPGCFVSVFVLASDSTGK